MKTQDETKSVPSFDELVFENRNMEYGAYTIRKKYNVALIWSILVSAFFVSATVITPFIVYDNGPVPVIYHGDSTRTVEFDSTLIKINELRTEQPKPEQVAPTMARFIPPVIVDSLPDKQPDQLLAMDDLNNTIKDNKVFEVVDSPRPEIDPDDDPTRTVETFQLSEQPIFGNGGENEFRNWVAQNIKYPQLQQENGIQGKVYVKFVVEKDGSLTNIEVVRAVDPDLGKEAVRVLGISPKWIPGKQQGNPVRVNFNFSITFALNQ